MQVLTLANNERILLTEDIRLVFEATDLRNASPATVSRAGIVYMDEVRWQPYLQSWMSNLTNKDLRAVLGRMIKKYIPETLRQMGNRTKLKYVTKHTNIPFHDNTLLTLNACFSVGMWCI